MFDFGPVHQPNVQNPNDFEPNYFDLSKIRTSLDFGRWLYINSQDCMTIVQNPDALSVCISGKSGFQTLNLQLGHT